MKTQENVIKGTQLGTDWNEHALQIHPFEANLKSNKNKSRKKMTFKEVFFRL